MWAPPRPREREGGKRKACMQTQPDEPSVLAWQGQTVAHKRFSQPSTQHDSLVEVELTGPSMRGSTVPQRSRFRNAAASQPSLHLISVARPKSASFSRTTTAAAAINKAAAAAAAATAADRTSARECIAGGGHTSAAGRHRCKRLQ